MLVNKFLMHQCRELKSATHDYISALRKENEAGVIVSLCMAIVGLILILAVTVRI